MKAVILAGGLGTRMSEETMLKPKPMIEIGGKPMLWHIMKMYSAHGVSDFVICCGYHGYVIKEYFVNYFLHMSDFTFDLQRNSIKVNQRNAEPWRVTLVDTGDSTMTGGRIRRVADYVKDDEAFCLTYGGGVSGVDLTALLAFHRDHGQMATITAIYTLGRFGTLELRADERVESLKEKPKGGMINGGVFVLSPREINLADGDETTREREPLERLAEMGELKAHWHEGFWQSMDTQRDKTLLDDLWASGRAHRKVWQ